MVNTDFYQQQDGVWKDMRGDSAYLESLLPNSTKLKVVGICGPMKKR